MSEAVRECAAHPAAGLRVGYLTQATVARHGHGYVTKAGLGRLVEALEERAGSVLFGASLAPAPTIVHDYELGVRSHHVVTYPYVASMAHAFLMTRALRRVVAQLEEECDVVIVQLPWAPPHSLAFARRPRVYHVCADVRGVVGSSTYYRGIRRVAARTAARIVDVGQRALMAGDATRTVTNGLELYQHYGEPAGRPVVSSPLRATEIGSVPRRRPSSAPPRVLFVGFLRPEKGIDVLLDAFDTVSARVPSAELRLIGTQDLFEGGAARDIVARVAQRRGTGTIEHLGYLSFGPRLFAEYADADVVVVPSLSEGTPRVIMEARAFGAAVIGSRVGGIPTSIEHGVDGLLVEPGDAPGLAEAILELILDPARRQVIAAGGLARVRRSTVDVYADQILAEAVAACGGAA